MGLVYTLIGVLAFQVALGDREQADQNGALRTIAQQPGGRLVLWTMVVGFLAYVAWRFTQAAWGRRNESDERKRTAKRVASAADGLLYLVLALLVARTAASASSSGSASSSLTARVLAWPGGTSIVVGVGFVVVAVGLGLTVRGVRTDFDEHLDKASMGARAFGAARRLGQVGHVARGLVVALVGALVIKAALGSAPGKAEGFDAALKSLAEAPYGRFLLMAAAVGLVCFGAYCAVEARYRRL